MAYFSIVVVSYRAGEKLKKTLENVLAQSCGDLRIIVKDAASDDGSVEAARAACPDERITWIVEADRGIYDGMNRAIRELDGESLVLFLNCGDLFYDTQVLAHVREEAERIRQETGARPEILYGDIAERRTGERFMANPRLDAFACYRNIPNHQAIFYEASLLMREQFDTAYRVRADYEHFLRCFFRLGIRPRAMDLIICDYEGGGFSESPEGARISAAEHRAVTALYYTPAQRARYRAYLILTLQPLRAYLAGSRLTAGLYRRVREGILKK